jgi:hypothetical protein
VPGRNCVFFTNNPALRAEIEAKGWAYRLETRQTLSADFRLSSQQSKYIKFLQFLEDYPEFKETKTITYFDHKFHVKDEHVAWILGNMLPGKSVLARTTPRLKSRISDEIEEAMGQPRYACNMAQTIRWIEQQINAGEISEQVRIVNTGLIHYHAIAPVMPMLARIHHAVWELGQPECQIIWAALSQKYADHIQLVDWRDLDIRWEAP